MTKTIKTLTLLGLTAALTAGTGTSLLAADAPKAPETTPTTTRRAAARKAAPFVVTGKILVIDKKAQTMTVEVKGKLQFLKLREGIKMVKAGKLVTIDDLAPGQEVSVLTRALPDGSLEVVAVSVEPSEASEPAGKGGNGGGGGGGTVNRPPFPTLPNPALEHIPAFVSPNR